MAWESQPILHDRNKNQNIQLNMKYTMIIMIYDVFHNVSHGKVGTRVKSGPKDYLTVPHTNEPTSLCSDVITAVIVCTGIQRNVMRITQCQQQKNGDLKKVVLFRTSCNGILQIISIIVVLSEQVLVCGYVKCMDNDDIIGPISIQ